EVERLELDRLVATRQARIGLIGSARSADVTVRKELVLGGDRRSPSLELRVTVSNRSAHLVEAIFGLEWTLTMLGGGGNPSAWWEIDGRRSGHDTRGSAQAVMSFGQGNDYVGVAVDSSV